MSASAEAASTSFDVWLQKFRADASQRGISEETLNTALSSIQFDESVIKLDRKQPEKTKRFEQYTKSVLPASRIERAREELSSHWDSLSNVQNTYGVPPEFVVALWGIESNFGDRMGSFNIVEALATLAYDGRRSEYFRGELIKALEIIDAGHISAYDMVGSWAGAMGQCQFMPSSFLNFAVDANGDGKKDIWYTSADVFASIANYLDSVGWVSDAGIASKVSISHTTFNKYKSKKATLNEWERLGVEAAGTIMSPTANYELVSGNHDNSGPYYLVSPNYHNILKWNRSRYFALAVSELATAVSAGVTQ